MINLFITGGFIGSNFINYIFYTKKYKIINFDAMYYCAKESNIWEYIRNSENYYFINGNLCDFSFVKYIIESMEIKYIIHFAAQSHVQNAIYIW